jgi:hypothetical protein
LIPTPYAEELVFHVKHTPVEQSAPAGRSFLDEAMHTRIDDLHGQDLGDLRDPGNALACEVRPSTLATVLDTRYELAATCLDTANDSQEVSSARKKLFALIRTERTTVRQEVDRLEQARLTRAVFSDDACCLRIERQVGSADAPEILDIDRGQHIARAARQSRIGMTTYFACGVEPALTRQLLLESVRPSSTCPASIAANASSR